LLERPSLKWIWEEALYYENIRKTDITKQKAVMHSTVHGTGADSVIDKELAEAARVRGLESEGDAEDSDDDTELFFMVEHPKASDTDPNSKRHRRFFYKCLEEVLSSIRSWESNILHYSETSKGGKPGEKSEHLPATISFNTMAEGNSCVLSSCGKATKPSRGSCLVHLFIVDISQIWSYTIRTG
jgi:hypothetical protein